jgi:hypothetical protein
MMPSGDVLIPQAAMQLFGLILASLIPTIATLFWLAWNERGKSHDEYVIVADQRYKDIKDERDRVLAAQVDTQHSIVAVLSGIKEGLVHISTRLEDNSRQIQQANTRLDSIQQQLQGGRSYKSDRG